MSSLNKILVAIAFSLSVSLYLCIDTEICKYHKAYNALSIIANVVILEDIIYFDIKEKKLVSL